MNKRIVSDWAKKNFLHWFMENYPLTPDVLKEGLSQITGDELLLSRIHIVFDGSDFRPLLVVSAEGTGMPPFLLKTDDSTITGPEAIINRLHLLEDSPIYLTLYFPDRATCEPLKEVTEENPRSVDGENGYQVLLDFEISLWSETFRHELERTEIMKQIDQALDEKNKRKFRHLVKKLKAL
ncbi:MAG TPA: YpiB family protein [Bacillota bacterium]|nr:YpiB family protein [Bacillota bacterium]